MQKRPKGWETARDDPNHIGELLVTIDGKQYAAQDIVSCEIERNLLENTAEVGNATAAVLTLEISQGETIPKRAKAVVQYRLMLDDARTDYIPKGTYWINTREKDGRYLKLTCYDAMLMAQQDYLGDVTADDWPQQETACVTEIAQRIGVEIDPRTQIGTGDNHQVSMPVGRTMREVLEQIAAANGGNWCITPAGKLLLVPFAGTGDVLPAVSGAPDCGDVQAITGVRVVRNDTDTPLLAGDETGTVLEVENENGTQALADELAQKLVGLPYAPYTCDQRYIDPVAEAGDKITVGSVACVAYNIKESLGPSHYADLEAPAEAGELEEEYPYQNAAERVKKQLGTVTASVAEIRKDQKSIEAEVKKTTETVAQNTQDIEAARKEATEKSEAAADAAKKYADDKLLEYSTTEETKSLIDQKADSITLNVTKTVTDTVTKEVDGKLEDYSTKSQTESAINVALDGIKLGIRETDAWTDGSFGDNTWRDFTQASVSDDVLTITAVKGRYCGASLYVPDTLKALLPGRKVRVTYEYKVTQELSGATCGFIYWIHYANETSDGYYGGGTWANSTKTAAVSDWKTVTFTFTVKSDTITRMYFQPRLDSGATGQVQVRNVSLQYVSGTDNSFQLTKDGVTISSAVLNTSGFASRQDVATLQLSHDSLQASVTKNSQDLAALKLSHESLEASVIKDGEVRSKFAMDTSSVTISGGIITFSGNTLVVESDNFKLTKSGSVSITGSITSKGNTGNAAVNEGLITLDALNANGKRYSTVYLGRTAKDYPSGALIAYSRRADGTVGRGVYIHGSDTDANIWMFDAYDKEKVHLSTGTYSNFNGGINVTGNYGVQVSYGVSCQTLSAWQSKSGIAKTSFGNLQIGAIEAPEPMYADAGSGICDVNGLCHIYADPRYAESVSQYKQSRWIITPVNSGGNLWVEKTDSLNVIVHGKKYQMFDWLCLTPKANGSTEYAEITDAEEPKNADETKNMLDMIVSESAEEEQNAYNALFDF